MSRGLPSTEKLDELAAQVIAGVESEASTVAAQPFFELMMEQVEKSSPKARRYTGAELFLREPIKFRAVVGYIAEGRGQLWIAERVGCSHHTVRAVRDHFPQSVAIEKERLAELCQRGATILAEKIVEEPDKLPPQAWGMTLGILADKALLLRGGATVITEKRHVFTHEDFNNLVAQAPAIDVESEAVRMGYDAGKVLPMGAGAGTAPAADPAPGCPGDAPAAGTDSESIDLQRADDPAPPPAPCDPPEDRGGGGRGSDAGGASNDAS